MELGVDGVGQTEFAIECIQLGLHGAGAHALGIEGFEFADGRFFLGVEIDGLLGLEDFEFVQLDVLFGHLLVRPPHSQFLFPYA